MFPKHLLTKVLAGTVVIVAATTVSASGHEEAAAELDAALHLTPNLENGRKVFQLCNVCHTPEGWGTENGMYPQIAGQLASVTIKQLADIRARNRDNPTMRPFTSPQLLGGVQEIADVAAYIEALPMNPNNGVGPGNDLEHGAQVYKDNCVDCHGDNGQGDQKDHIPLIQGQHFRYLMRQFEWIRTGKRRNADPKMVKQIRRFSPRDITAVMDYVSRQKPTADKIAEPGWQNPDFPKYSRQPMPHTPIYGRPQPPAR
ncbi:MAG: c-type cytochrome [Sedimenticola sp.]